MTKGFCGASGEATARGVNLYEDMVADCQQHEAANHTGTVQNGQKSQTCRRCSMRTRGVPNSPLQGLSEYTPHTPPYWTANHPPTHPATKKRCTGHQHCTSFQKCQDFLKHISRDHS